MDKIAQSRITIQETASELPHHPLYVYFAALLFGVPLDDHRCGYVDHCQFRLLTNRHRSLHDIPYPHWIHSDFSRWWVKVH